ncbi:MAG: radical SAM protein [Candidatus Woesearchaeota archaeon]|nr:radical SAM protein [Candidatus Woesearchaeota archaeon]
MRTIDEVMAQPWNLDLPKAIQIETSSLCNAKCTFCPYEATSQAFPKGNMSNELVVKILKELAEFQPLLVAPYLNNEPLADKRLLEFLRLIRRDMPKTFIDISTNGSALTERIAQEITDPKLAIDEIKINFTTTNPEEYERIMGLNYQKTLTNVLKFVETARRRGFHGGYRIIIVESVTPEQDRVFWQNHGIDVKVYTKISRGGLIQTGHQIKERVSGCKYDREKEWLHILHTGEVILCCMDWKKQHILGDLRKSSIKEIWDSQEYRLIRNKISDSSDRGFICNNCEWGKPYEK